MTKTKSMNDTEKIKQYYSEWWENPNDIRNIVFESLNKYVRLRIPPGNGKRALDIGSGHGRIVSYLLEKGYQVTAVEFNEEFVAELKSKYLSAEVISEDVRNIQFGERYDIVTCIELVQNLRENELLELLTKVAQITATLLINMSNGNSFHGRWVKLRGFKANFCYNYGPGEFDRILERAGFNIVHRRGIGLVTPISLFENFRGKLVPVRLAKVVNKLDPLATKICHLYYVEATSRYL